MSEQTTLAKKVKHGSATDVVLEHFGVKGMRWGVQKERKKSGKSTAKKVAKKIAPMDVEGMKNDPLNKAAVKVAKAAVTPIGEKGLLQNKKDVLAIRAKVREKLAKRQEKIADDYDQMAGELDGAAKAMSKGSDAKSTAKVKEVRKKFDRDWGFNDELETASDFKTMADELRKEGQTFRDSSVKNYAKAQEHRDKSAEYWGKKKVKHESATDVVLKHYGIKGMKWGQRKDSSTSSKRVDPSSMSDDELRTAVKRLNLEQQYVSLTSKRVDRNKTSRQQGQEEVNKILKNVGKNSIQSMANAVVPAAIGVGTSAVTAGASYVAARMIIKGLYGK